MSPCSYCLAVCEGVGGVQSSQGASWCSSAWGPSDSCSDHQAERGPHGAALPGGLLAPALTTKLRGGLVVQLCLGALWLLL